MLMDDLRCIYAIVLKDLRAYYFKPPNISWGMIFPFAFLLAFVIRNPGDTEALVPGLLALTLLFGTTSMEAIVITFEQRIGALERLMLAPMRLSALLVGKLLGGVIFGMVTAAVTLGIGAAAFGVGTVRWALLVSTMLLSAAAFSAIGVLVSVSVNEVFEAQTLANGLRFPMIFLGGVFVPIASLPDPLPVVARLLPLTYGVEALRYALGGAGSVGRSLLDLGLLAVFTAVLFVVATRVLAKRTA
jgi:ABC-2 type transport system permease protein